MMINIGSHELTERFVSNNIDYFTDVYVYESQRGNWWPDEYVM